MTALKQSGMTPDLRLGSPFLRDEFLNSHDFLITEEEVGMIVEQTSNN